MDETSRPNGRSRGPAGSSTHQAGAAAHPRPPSVERLLAAARPRLGRPAPGHAALLAAARQVIAAEREALARGAASSSIEALAERVAALLAPRAAGPGRAINATGVIVHTNLGRAPWPRAAIDAALEAASGGLFLELDRESGRRGRRYRAAEDALVALTGAGDALVTNNNAAAVGLAVGLAGRGGGVVVSRGELVEIGGGVRIPEIIRRAGARLVEVGTTNRTRVADYTEALADGRARVVLRVHPSNFRIEGFTEAPDPVELAAVAHAHGAILVDDLGSGALLDTAAYGLAHEPMPSERLAGGADLVTFSGDKLLGGPQGGLIVGRADLIVRLRRDPLARAVRPDKVSLAALAATLDLYRRGVATVEIPVWRMISADPQVLRTRAAAVIAAVPGSSDGHGGPGSPDRTGSADPRGPGRWQTAVVGLHSTVGGGSLPGETLPSFGVAIAGRDADSLLTRLRTGDPAVVGRIADGRVLLDLRTVDPAEDARLVDALRGALAGASGRR